jgi:GNAT superfamily N-acetyltransferase
MPANICCREAAASNRMAAARAAQCEPPHHLTRFFRHFSVITLATASTDAHLQGILALQRRNHLRTVPEDVQSREGFVFVEHTLPLLRRMAEASPQAIALSDGHVVGYCLSLPLSLQAEVPSLAPLFEQFGRCAFRGRPLSAHRFVVGGQVCVDRAFRGQGLLARLYDQLRVSLAHACDLCVTEIATRNRVSVRAHEKMGFEAIATYDDGRESWVIVAWEFARAGD